MTATEFRAERKVEARRPKRPGDSEVLGAGTPQAAVLTVSLILDDRVGRVMKRMSRMQLQLRTLDPLAELVGRAGWAVVRTAGRGFVHEVVSLKRA